MSWLYLFSSDMVEQNLFVIKHLTSSSLKEQRSKNKTNFTDWIKIKIPGDICKNLFFNMANLNKKRTKDKARYKVSSLNNYTLTNSYLLKEFNFNIIIIRSCWLHGFPRLSLSLIRPYHPSHPSGLPDCLRTELL